jgi:hypothetical protein
MARKTNKTPDLSPDRCNLVLARTVLEAIKIRENAGFARNAFTGRAYYKLTNCEAAREAAPDESTAQLVTLILETRDEAFIEWARQTQGRNHPPAAEDKAD